MNAIEIRDLSKIYRLGAVSTGTISHDLNRWWYSVRGLEDPYAKIAESNARDTKGTSDYVWSLKDVNLDVKQGEILGIIGKNGAGKSTLLKILSRVTGPTKGKVTMHGRVASLLEVGTGFHPELTGRENIFLNGAILGMTKKEIRSKFDEIVSFSGVERYVDTPVKRYSSGMYVRLAFAVAAHLEPEILIVDEVLAVGDAEFQKKCIGKMKDVSDREGRTVLFVSHNLPALTSLCSRAVLMTKGNLVYSGEPKDVVSHYLNEEGNPDAIQTKWAAGANISEDHRCQLNGISFVNKELNVFNLDESIEIEIEYEILNGEDRYNLSLSLFAGDDTYILSSPSISDQWFDKPHTVGVYRTRVTLPANFLNEGDYYITLLLVQNAKHVAVEVGRAIYFKVVDDGKKRGGYYGKWSGVVRLELPWRTVKN